CQHHYGTPPTF
nr:immunoglobulin light chain junction region [Mus musculus]NSM02639.1 immunoglobulin light chain junction region [Mus musculus]